MNAYFEYQCRRCGQMFTCSDTDAERAEKALLASILGVPSGFDSPPAVTLHRTCGYAGGVMRQGAVRVFDRDDREVPAPVVLMPYPGVGVADLVGYRVEE